MHEGIVTKWTQKLDLLGATIVHYTTIICRKKEACPHTGTWTEGLMWSVMARAIPSRSKKFGLEQVLFHPPPLLGQIHII
jgi:hypothetical protein